MAGFKIKGFNFNPAGKGSGAGAGAGTGAPSRSAMEGHGNALPGIPFQMRVVALYNIGLCNAVAKNPTLSKEEYKDIAIKYILDNVMGISRGIVIDILNLRSSDYPPIIKKPTYYLSQRPIFFKYNKLLETIVNEDPSLTNDNIHKMAYEQVVQEFGKKAVDKLDNVWRYHMHSITTLKEKKEERDRLIAEMMAPKEVNPLAYPAGGAGAPGPMYSATATSVGPSGTVRRGVTSSIGNTRTNSRNPLLSIRRKTTRAMPSKLRTYKPHTYKLRSSRKLSK
jgi:hypothetical protein